MKKIELMAPAGSLSTLRAAVNAGADAVYFGLKEFSMRANAKNFEVSDLDELRTICNSSPRKVKMYLTLNTIIYDDELSKIEETIKKVKGKIDAVICWDMAIISLCKKYKIPFFISTQASVANKDAALFYKHIGAERVVLARELSLEQVKEISKFVDTEVFVHGAMCVSISGRCFTSQFLYGKSANRGECLQPCRRAYKIIDEQTGKELKLENSKVMSAKDLCTLPFIGKLKDSGVVSFKIEGRNRDERYVDTVVRAYRKAIDKNLSQKEIDESLEELKKVYNKEFSAGFYLGVPTSDDFSKEENSAATEKKHFVALVTKYLPKIGVALLKVSSPFKVGDKVCVIGPETGIIYSNVQKIEINNSSVKEAKKGDEVGIKLPKVKKNDEVYIILDNLS